MSSILKNKMIQNLINKAPANVKALLEEVLSDDTLSITEKINKLQSLIEGDKNYEKAKKMSSFFSSGIFKKKKNND
jgi:hypothetical protein